MKNLTATTNHDTRPVLLLPAPVDALTLDAAASIRDNHRRHAVNLPEVLVHPAYWPDSPTYRRDASRAVYSTLSYLYQQDGVHLWLETAQQWHRDQTAERLPEIGAAALRVERLHDLHRAQAETLQDKADRISTPAPEAEDARRQAAALRAQADREQAEADELGRIIATTTHTDHRADLYQVGAAVLYQTGDIKAARAAIRRAIRGLATPCALTSCRTDYSPMTEQDARAWLTLHPGTPDPTDPAKVIPAKVDHITRKGTRDGYITVEHRDATKTRPAGWYSILHRYTVAPYISYETFASGEGAAAIATNDGITAAMDGSDLDRLEALFDAANLKPREREICKKAVDVHAMEDGARAVGQHYAAAAARADKAPTPAAARRILRDADKQADKTRHAAMLASACRRAGIESDRTRRAVLARIRAALEPLRHDPTPIDSAERERRAIMGAFSNRDRIQPATISRRPDTLPAPRLTVTTSPDTRDARAREYGREYATMGIRWVPLQDQPCTVIPQTRAAQDLPRTGRAGVTDPATRRKYAAEQAAAAAKAADVAARAAAHAAAGRTAQAAGMTAYAADLHSRACALAALLALGTPAEHYAAAAAEAAAAKAAAEAAKADAQAAAQERRKQEQDAAKADAQAAAQEISDRRKAAYNAAIRAALHDMGTTWTAATQGQRDAATARARAAMDAVTD